MIDQIDHGLTGLQEGRIDGHPSFGHAEWRRVPRRDRLRAPPRLHPDPPRGSANAAAFAVGACGVDDRDVSDSGPCQREHHRPRRVPPAPSTVAVPLAGIEIQIRPERFEKARAVRVLPDQLVTVEHHTVDRAQSVGIAERRSTISATRSLCGMVTDRPPKRSARIP